jgi:hypothetical protein
LRKYPAAPLWPTLVFYPVDVKFATPPRRCRILTQIVNYEQKIVSFRIEIKPQTIKIIIYFLWIAVMYAPKHLLFFKELAPLFYLLFSSFG